MKSLIRKPRSKRLALVAAISSVVLLAACAGKPADQGSSAPQGGSAAAGTAGANGAAGNAVTIKFWTPLNGNASPVVKSLGELPMVQQWEKKTNVKFDFQHPTYSTANDVIQQYGVMIASGDLPDVMLWSWKSLQGSTTKMYNDGTIIKLNDLIDKYAPNLKQIMAANPDVAKQIKADNGDIYAFPHLRVGDYGKYSTFSGLMIRQDWLDELGLKAPETIDEWETVLKAFKDKKGVIPFTADKDHLFGTSTSSDFAGAYGLPNFGQDFYVDGGKVKFGPLQPAYKDYLAKMRMWYEEGLIDPDFATNDSKAIDAKVTAGKAGAFFGWIGASMSKWVPALQQANPKAMIAAVQYPVLHKGDQPKFIPTNWNYDNTGAVVTKSNKHPEETIKAFDYLFSEEGSTLKNFGIEGQTYTLVNGQPKFNDLIMHNPDKLPLGQAMAKYFIANYPFIGPDDDRYTDQYYAMQTQKDALKMYSKYADNAYKVMLPPTSPTPEESAELAKIMTDVNTYRGEIATKIVMGTEPLSSFDKAIDQFKKMKIDRAVEIVQAEYDRYNKR